jgi:hypothetical protein
LEGELNNLESECKDWKNWKNYRASSSERTGKVEYNFVFAGTEQVFLEPEFKGGEINVVFGGMSLDLRNTHLPEGKTTYLEINAVFGGVKILAPSTWDIELKGDAILGGFKDKRRKIVSNDSNAGHLIIKADCICSGGEII